jgi:N-formylglutamate amidohydrolase
MRDGVAGFGVGAEAALAEAGQGQRAARADVENCWAPYCQRLPSRARRVKAQHGETKLRH